MSNCSAKSPEQHHRHQDFEWLTEVEEVTGYVPGGYHPVCLGDDFHQRYKIIHKLGYGSVSTVWLAKDKVDATYKALKLLASADSVESRESEILRHLSGSSAPGKSDIFTPTLLDEFMVTGPNGVHWCLVTEVSGCSIASSAHQSSVDFFNMEVARSIAAQIVLAVQFLHSKGVAHGDLHSGNILFTLPKLDDLSQDEIYERLGTPRKQDVRLRNGEPLGDQYPPYEVESAKTFVNCKDVLPGRSIRLCDFGEAYFADKKDRFESHTPDPLAPPESVLGPSDQPLGLPSDIWTLACTVCEVFSNYNLFSRYFSDVVSCLGPANLPMSWAERWTEKDRYLDENGAWSDQESGLVPLDERVQELRELAADDFSDAEQKLFVSMLESMLKFEPAERATADEVVGSRWMQKWGLPSLKKQGIAT